ncbi:MAG: choice-of-anchor R domain-containing protein [Solirubrobacterales bacterium]
MLLPAGVTLAPDSWDAQAIGGSDTAEIILNGPIEAVADAIHWLGYAAWIMSPDSEYVWWGDIEAVEIMHNGVMTGITLEGVANAIKVLYTVFDPGGGASAGETDWATDEDSISLYGRRERQHSAETAMREAQAEQMRDTLLARVSRPVPMVGGVSAGSETYATLRCTGFWKRLDRVYYENLEGLTEFTDGGFAYPLGVGFTSDYVATVSLDKKYHFHQLYGRFAPFAIENMQFTVSGSASNDGTFTVISGDAKEPVSYTANNIRFNSSDDVEEATPKTYMLDQFGVDDVIYITGPTEWNNTGTHLVKTSTTTRIEVSPGYKGEPYSPGDYNIVNEAAGMDVTILRGNSVTVEQTVIIEHANTGATVTVTAYGQMIAQSFQTGTSAPWTAAHIELRICKVGTPTDGVYVRLKSDSAGVPGALLDSALLDDTDFTSDEQGEWAVWTLANTVSLSPATTYWIEVLRSGANDSENYYELFFDDAAGYSGGVCKLYDGSAYQSPILTLSLCFRVLGAEDTALQVKEICNSADVFSGVTVVSPSGVYSNQYRDGTQFASAEVGALLDTGDGSDVRLLATVGPQRNVTIRSQPASTTARYVWKGSDNLCTLQGSRETLGLLPAAGYCHINDPILLQGSMAQVSPFLIEYARYSVGDGWELRAAEQPDPWLIGEVKNE